jgi:hypothetical protein
MRKNTGLATGLHTLWIGAYCLVVGLMTAPAFGEVIGAYVLMLSAVFAWCTATSLMFEGVRTLILPVGQTEKAEERPDFDVGAGEPGVQHGQ